MKKLITLFTIAGMLLMLSSCEDGLTLRFDANFKVNMNIDVEDTGKGDTFPFSETQTLNIEDDKEVAKQIEKIKELDITEIECEVTGIPSGQSIPLLKMYVEEIDLTVTLEDITENHIITLPISEDLLNALSNYLFENHQATVTVSGESTYAPMVLGVNLTFKSKVAASI
ncbi:MAG: hypothetical protein RBT19_12755 [Tenuifilaceae bacterium]|jgi:hypothetical protein|nr:hypothetical protein [Tenuifilaceae bacterium]